MKVQRFKIEHSSKLCREETAKKQNATQTGRVFISRGNTKMLPQQDECRPRFYQGKDKVGCRNIASLMHGGPTARARQMGQYFPAVL